MNDVPRSANGWPTIEPNAFTLEQLLVEAEKWRNSGDHPDTVGQKEWRKYTKELVRRGFLDEVEVRTWKERGLPTVEQIGDQWVVEFPLRKPPLGLLPKKLWLEQRCTRIRDAIERYDQAGLLSHPSVADWRAELNQHEREIKSL